MKHYKLLILTDHHRHSVENSLYALARTMSKSHHAGEIDVASRGTPKNTPFFKDLTSTEIHVVPAHPDFSFENTRALFEQPKKIRQVSDYDAIFLRLARPFDKRFFDFLTQHFDTKKIFNRPKGIEKTGSKGFLLNVAELCPPVKLCQTEAEIEVFSSQFPIVLKPLDSSGGLGIMKVENGQFFDGNQALSRYEAKELLAEGLHNGGYLAMKFLKNVSEGDKRIIVVNGKIVGSALRKPPAGAWLCNASQGGSSHFSEPDEQEQHIAKVLSPILAENGVVMFGFDTLVNDEGKRVLSEINTASIGGVMQAERLSGQPVLQRTADLLWDYVATVGTE